MREVKMKGHGMEWNELPVPSSFLSHVSIGPSHVDRRGQSPTVLTPPSRPLALSPFPGHRETRLPNAPSYRLPRHYRATTMLSSACFYFSCAPTTPTVTAMPPVCFGVQLETGRLALLAAAWPATPTTLARGAERAPNANHDVHHLGP
jgi:hypothetical protein